MLNDIVAALAPRIAPTPVLLGQNFLRQEDSPPRVILVPTRDKFGPTQRPGGSQRILLTRFAGVQIHCWGADVATTETLAHQVLAALYLLCANDLDITQIAANGFKLVDGGWLDQGWTSMGNVWLLNVEFQFPVLAGASPTKVVTSIPQTAELETPGDPPTEQQG